MMALLCMCIKHKGNEKETSEMKLELLFKCQIYRNLSMHGPVALGPIFKITVFQKERVKNSMLIPIFYVPDSEMCTC